MKIRKTWTSDLNDIMDIYEEAKRFMQKTGNGNQWVNGYPSREIIEADIVNENHYSCIDDSGCIKGVFCFMRQDEPSYSTIYDGAWLNDKPYGVIHRLAATEDAKGVADRCLQWCYDQCGNIRIDTHRENLIMQKILIRNGYIKCGTIHLTDGSERTAFQKY